MTINNGLSNNQIEGLIYEDAEELYELAPCGYITMLPNGVILRVNATFLHWLGYTRSDLVQQKRFQDLLTIGAKIYYETHFAPLLQMQGFVNEVNLDLKTLDNKVLPGLINIVRVNDAEGKVLLYRATIFNIADRKKYEQELVRARQKAEEATKAKASFISTVSHEIRTPLNAIIGISNLLNDTPLNPRQQQLVNVLNASAGNLLHLINDILDFSKMEAGKVSLNEKDVHLRDLLMSTLYGLALKAEEKGIQLITELDEHLPEFVKTDPVKLTQVLTNLVGNAIKFTNEGSVTVLVRAGELTKRFAKLRFSVTDTGIGVPADQLQHIFEEFAQARHTDAKVHYPGTGLGLAISQKLLHLYGSKLNVESQEGKGSVFWFDINLPYGQANTADAQVGSPSIQQAAPQSLAGVRLLLAEDNEVNVFVVRQFLDKWGVHYAIATNGQEAVDMVQQSDYDLVLMDLQMPVLNGYDACLRIRQLPDERYRQLPVIALSASTKFDLEEKLAAAQLTDFVGKPFDPAQLHSVIAHYSGKEQVSEYNSTQPAPATSLNQQAAVDLTEYLSLTYGDEDAQRELMEMTIRNLKLYRQAFIKALHEHDETAFGFYLHKSKMPLEMLQATQALEVLHKGAYILQQTTIPAAQLQQIVQEVDQHVSCVIEALQDACPAPL